MVGAEANLWKNCIAALALALVAAALSPPGASADEASEFGVILKLFDRGEYSKAIEELIAFRSKRPSEKWGKRALYLLGHASAKEGKNLDALQYFSRAAALYGEMADYAEYNIAKTLAASGDYNRAAFAYRRLRTLFPRSRLMPRALLGEAESLLALGECWRASALFEESVNRYPDSYFAPEALEKAALCSEKAGARDKAFEIYKRIYIEYPASRQADVAMLKLEAIASDKGSAAPRTTEREAIARAIGLYRAGLFERAAPEFKTVAQTSSSTSLAAVASFKFASSLRRLGKRAEAYSAFIDYAERFPGEMDAPEALYNALVISLQDGSDNKAKELLRKIERLYPRHEAMAKSLLALGGYAEKERRFPSALALYSRLKLNFKDSPLAAEALWRSGWIEYRSGNYRRSAEQFQLIAKLYPRSSYGYGAIFWTAYSYEKSGAKRKAIPLHQRLAAQAQLSYYGAAAKDRLNRLGAPAPGDELDLGKSARLKGPRIDLDGLKVDQDEEFHLARVRELTTLSFSADAYEELKILDELLPRERRYRVFLGKLYRDSGFTMDSIKLLNAVLDGLAMDEQKGLPSEFWSMLYPRDFWDKAIKHSREAGLDPYLVLSIIRQESAFDSKAVSSSGALGLMQIMPSTGRWLLAKTRSDSFAVDSLFDPELNVALGTGYFADLLKSHGNSLPLALASYNAGRARVNSWLKEARGGESQEELIERIPFNETRNYVKSVLRNYAVYKKLYGQD